MDDQVGVPGPGLGAPDAFGFDRVGGFAQSGGVDQGYRHAAEDDAGFERVPGGARNVGHDRNVSLR
jgi:hypothetical protein